MLHSGDAGKQTASQQKNSGKYGLMSNLCAHPSNPFKLLKSQAACVKTKKEKLCSD